LFGENLEKMPCGKEENVKKIVERKFWSGKRRIRRVPRRAKSFFFPFEGKKENMKC
jgi:hypothetical protein